VEAIQAELGQAQSINDFFGREGIFARLFARTLEEMLAAELSEHLGYEKYEAKGTQEVPDSGNSRNGSREKTIATSVGEQVIQVPRDRKGEFQSPLLEEKRSSELEGKILVLYGKGNSTRDIQELLADTYGVEVSATTISAITDKIWPLVEEWQQQPLPRCYPVIYLDALYLKLRRENKTERVAVYIVLGVDLNGRKEVLGHWPKPVGAKG
jgi:putative transposase